MSEEEKDTIVEASKKLSIGYSTFTRMVVLKEARKILGEQNANITTN